jgi:anaerobic magnesium-protoporphyrin IX monomethyl ester cyclase
MRVALVYPPTCDPTAPYLAVPMLTGFLRANGVEVLPIDANIEAYDRLLRPAPLGALADRVEQRLRTLEQRPALDHGEQLAYAALFRARGDALAVPDAIAEAVAILRDPGRFFEPEHYARAVDTVDAALRLVSAAYHPLRLDFTAYRTPFALLTPEEIARDAAPERDPFDDYVCQDLIPRLRAARADVIGLSICFPGQLQPAYAFALKLKQALPQAHLTVGGPAITQLLIRLRGPDLARALGPFDSAVVFEGEHTLLALVRALEEKPGQEPARAFAGLTNIVHRDRLMGAKFAPGHASEDLRALPAPDFDGLALDRYFAPRLVLPYDPTRGCYWGKCTFCHYGLAEVGTASYRERPVELMLAHLRALSQRYGTRYFYFSQDSVAPKTLLKLSGALADAELGLAWATDLKPEKYLTAERAQVLRRGGAVACALGVESGSPRVLRMIDKGAPVEVVGDVIDRLDAAGIAVEAMCFTGFPTETADEALQTLDFLDDRREQVAAFIVGEFDLTHGALVAQDPARFGIDQVWQVAGDELGTGLFYSESQPSKPGDGPAIVDRALDELASGWLLRRYPWAGSLSTAHTVFYYERYGKGVMRALAQRVRGGVIGARTVTVAARFDLTAVARAEAAEARIWYQLVRERRQVSRADYQRLAAETPLVRPRARRYRIVAGAPPVAIATPRRPARGRRPSARVNDLG